MEKNILLIGGGGHCKSVLDALQSLNEYSQIGIIDTQEKVGETVLGEKIIGSDSDLEALFKVGYRYAFISLGSIGNTTIRRKKYSQLKKLGFQIPTIIDKTAVLGRECAIEEGVFIGKNVVLNAGVTVKKCAILNTGVIVEHDCVVGDFSHLSPGVVLGGEVVIEKDVHVGINSSVRQQVKVEEASIIGMGSVVVKDVRENVLGYGNPFREVRDI